MWYCLIPFLIPILILAFIEEMIYYFVNRSVFGQSKFEQNCRNRLKQLLEKIKPKVIS